MLDSGPGTDYGKVWGRLTEVLADAFLGWEESRRAPTVTLKEDGSVLSDADTYIQKLIVSVIEEVDPDPHVLAEEEGLNTIGSGSAWNERVWVVDPIDGTAEYLRPGGREYCSAVAVLHRGVPVACLLFCPSLGRAGDKVVISVDGSGRPPRLNGSPAAALLPGEYVGAVSATRSSRRPPRDFEAELARRGVEVKTRASSLTLDMVRTCLDLRAVADLDPFDWFYRERQLVWDALPGMAVARAVGFAAVDREGESLVPLPGGIYRSAAPELSSVVVTASEKLEGALRQLGEEPAVPPADRA